MHVTREGNVDGPPVLLLHGAGVAGWMWEPVVRRLTGSRVSVPDLPGHGASASAPFHGTDATVGALARLLDRPAVVVGFSWGGQLAVALTARFPELVAATVVISSLARPLALAPLVDPLFAATLPLARSARFARLQGRALGVPDALLDRYVATSVGADPASLAGIVAANNRFTIPAGWGEGTAPALLVHGSAEGGAVRTSAAALRAARPGSRAAVVAGASHDVPFRAPAWLASEVQSLAGP